MERIFQSTPNGVLTVHTEWLVAKVCDTEAFSIYIYICAVHCDRGLVVVWLAAAQARGVLGSLVHFRLFHLILNI